MLEALQVEIFPTNMRKLLNKLSGLFHFNLKLYNYRLFMIPIVLNIFGILILRSAMGGDISSTQKQILGSLACIVVCFLLSLIDYRLFEKYSIFFYGLVVLLLIFLLIGGTSIRQTSRWIMIGSMQFQPSEFMKIAMIIQTAKYLSKNDANAKDIRVLLMSLVIVGLPCVVILLQPNLSTTVITGIIGFVIIVSSNINKISLVKIIVVILIIAIFLLLVDYFNIIDVPFIKSYQLERITSFFNHESGNSISYQQDNSKLAIGSGGFTGKGMLNDSIFSVKNGNWLAEEDNDFIFSIIGEETGFVGGFMVISLFLILSLMILNVASNTHNLFAKYYCMGVATWINFQSFVNISVALSIIPNTGVTLPFISKGLSSQLAIYVSIGIVLNISMNLNDLRRSYEIRLEKNRKSSLQYY